MAELWGVYCEEFGENWPRYNGTALYLLLYYWKLSKTLSTAYWGTIFHIYWTSYVDLSESMSTVSFIDFDNRIWMAYLRLFWEVSSLVAMIWNTYETRHIKSKHHSVKYIDNIAVYETTKNKTKPSLMYIFWVCRIGWSCRIRSW